MNMYGISWRWHPAASPAATFPSAENLESSVGNSCEEGKAPSFQSSTKKILCPSLFARRGGGGNLNTVNICLEVFNKVVPHNP